MATMILENIGSGNGLLPDGTKPLPEPMLTYHQRGSVAFFWEQVSQELLKVSIQDMSLKIWHFENYFQISQWPMS